MEYCNPLNLNDKYQHFGEKAHREGADPTLLLFKDRYYLFVSMSAGFYYSDNLVHWDWHENRELDMYNYAPDVRQIGEYVYFCASDKGRPCTIWRSRDPLSNAWEKVSAPFDFWDPDLFCDDDGRVYLTWGSSNDQPIWGQELDPETMTPVGERVGLYYGDKTRHGFERPYGSRLAVSGLRVFGLGDGAKPEAVKSVRVKRKDHGMTAVLRWPESKGAIGYNLRFGIAPDKLYSSYQVYGASKVRIVTLNAGKEYFFAVDAFNENGVTEGSVV